MESNPKARMIRFGEFEIDRDACELRRGGGKIPLQIQPFRVLLTLVDNAGQVVSREALTAAVWPGRVHVDFDHGLNNAVNRIRQALGDSSETPRFIETLPRIGYRFVHAVDSSEARPVVPADSESGAPNRSNRRIAVLAVVLIAMTAAYAGYRLLSRESPPASSVAEPPTQNVEALEAYLRAEKLRGQRNKESLRLAISELETATKLDPDFALAWASLAESYAGAGGPGASRYLSPEEALPFAEAAAANAMRLRPDLARSHFALARVLSALHAPSTATDLAIEQSFRRGLELDSSQAEAHLQFGNFLAKRGRSDEALQQFRQARQLDPLSPSINSRLGQELMAQGATAEGLELLRRTVETDPFQFNARMRLGTAYLELGDLEAAEREFAAAEGISPDSLQSREGLAMVAAFRGDMPRARTLLAGMIPDAQAVDDPFTLAIAYTILQQREPALEWLTRTVRETRILHRAAPWNLDAPLYNWLREEPAFRQLQQEVAAANAAAAPRGATKELQMSGR